MLNSYIKYTISMIIAFSLVGCGTTYSLKSFSPMEGQPNVAFIDIKQRAILSGKRVRANGVEPEIVMCAEPSPDALSSLTTELAADAKYKDIVTSTLSFSQQEAASFVGLRTQTIQLLRDGMYRLCEGYLTGALSQADFAWLSRRYQRNMVALLTIEQLTRVAQVANIGQTSQSMAAASQSVAQIQADVEKIDEKIDTLGKEKKGLEAEKKTIDQLPASDTTKTTKLEEIKSKINDQDRRIKSSSDIREALLDGLKTVKGVMAQGSTSVQVLAQGQEQRPSQNEEIAKLIANITTTVVLQDDLPTLCFQLLDGSRGENIMPELKSSCLDLVRGKVTLQIAGSNASEQSVGSTPAINEIQNVPKKTTTQNDSVLNWFGRGRNINSIPVTSVIKNSGFFSGKHDLDFLSHLISSMPDSNGAKQSSGN